MDCNERTFEKLHAPPPTHRKKIAFKDKAANCSNQRTFEELPPN